MWYLDTCKLEIQLETMNIVLFLWSFVLIGIWHTRRNWLNNGNGLVQIFKSYFPWKQFHGCQNQCHVIIIVVCLKNNMPINKPRIKQPKMLFLSSLVVLYKLAYIQYAWHLLTTWIWLLVNLFDNFCSVMNQC